MPAADRYHLNIPFKEYLKSLRVDADGKISQSQLDRVASQEFENYKAIERWAGTFSPTPLQTFHLEGALTATESDTYWLPQARSSRLFTGGVTTYGSGTVTVTLNKDGTAVATLSITGSGLFTVDAVLSWAKGDGMSAEVTGAGSGCSGLVCEVI